KAKRGWIDFGMAIVLSGEELVFRCKRSLDRADIEIPPVRRRCEIRVCRYVRERHDRLALHERRQCPFRHAEDTQSCQCQTPLKNFPARLFRHVRFSFLPKEAFLSRTALFWLFESAAPRVIFPSSQRRGGCAIRRVSRSL